MKTISAIIDFLRDAWPAPLALIFWAALIVGINAVNIMEAASR